MALTVKLGQDEVPSEEAKEPQMILNLNVRKTLDGNIAIFDNEDIDIVITPANNTIVAFPRKKFSDRTYDVQNRLFQFLREKGVIVLNSIQGGDIFGSLQATYPDNDTVSSLQTALLVISRFLEDEKEKYAVYEEFEEEFEDRYTDPDEDESTELGEIPHSSQKGSIRPGYIYSPYGISSVYRYE